MKKPSAGSSSFDCRSVDPVTSVDPVLPVTCVDPVLPLTCVDPVLPVTCDELSRSLTTVDTGALSLTLSGSVRELLPNIGGSGAVLTRELQAEADMER